MKAMVLAAGQGTRLRPLTFETPKPMVPIGNIPLIERTLRWLAREGVRDVMINLFHQPQRIKDYVGNGRLFGVNVTYSLEEELLGTAGAIKNCESFFDEEPFVVIYGDNLIDVQLRPLIERQAVANSDAVIGLFKTSDPTSCGLVVTDEENKIIRFQEKPPLDEVFTDQANGGIYVLSTNVFNYIPADRPYDFGKEVFPEMLSSGRTLHGLQLNGYLQDTGTPESYRQANEDALTGKVFGLRGKLIANDPNFTLIGDQVHLGPNVTFRGKNIVGQKSQIGAGAQLCNSIVWDNAKIPANAVLDGAIIGAGVELTGNEPIDSYSLIA